MKESKDNDNSRILITGGPVLSLDGVTPPQEAIVLEGDRIIGIGTEEKMSSLAGSKARRIDVDGATVMPGLIDTHPHVLHFGALQVGAVDISDARCHTDIMERIRARAKETPPGQWIMTTPVGELSYYTRRSFRDLAESRLPDRHVLDTATQEHPVFIQAWAPRTPNFCAFNSLGLANVGISSITPDRVCDVWIDKDNNGQPTGILHGSVNNYYNLDPYWLQISSKFPPPPDIVWAAGAQSSIPFYHQLGVTSVYEGHCMDMPHIEAYKELRARDELKIRVLATLDVANTPFHPELRPTREELLEMLELGKSITDTSDHLLRINGVTLGRSGPCWPGFLRSYEPFRDPYGRETKGVLFLPHWVEKETVKFCLENDVRLNIVMGVPPDHDDFFHSIEPYLSSFDIKDRKWIIQHSVLITEAQIKKYAELGMYSTTCVGFAWGKGDMYGERIGKHVWKDLIPLKRYLDSGMLVACGTDWGPKNVFEQIQLAETHEFCGSGHRNLLPGHAVTRQEAILMWTRDAARVIDWEGIGTLTPGNYADLIIVDRNPLTCGLDDLPDTQVLRTILGGQTVHDSGTL